MTSSVGVVDRERLRLALEAATRDLPAHERVAVAERVARELARRRRRTRYASPGALAHAIDPLATVETPALRLIDAAVLRAVERMEAGHSARLAVAAPPQEGKSRRLTVATPLWLLVRNPDLRIGIASFEADVATTFSRDVRNFIADYGAGTVLNPRPLAQDLLGISLRGDSTSVSRFSIAGHRGGLIAYGMKGGWTGKPLDALFVDDPYKDREQADSPEHRAKVLAWWQNVAVPRLPSAALVILTQCMTGDTSVRMADGTERALRDVRPGDRIGTYDGGRVGVSTVRAWKSQRYDSVYRIKTSSGAVVRANARHPFLVAEDGIETWRRTSDLRPGMMLLRATAPIEASPAPPTGAMNPRSARACATSTTAAPGGQPDSDPRPTPPAPDPDATPSSSTGTASPSTSTSASSPSRTAGAPSAVASPKRSATRTTGTRSSASTTATTATRCADCSATTATSPSAAPSTSPPSSAAPLTTWSVIADPIQSVEPAGVEEVFDVQVDRTENFLADGLVSHNTRWHPDDLYGYVLGHERALPEHLRRWEFVSIPAQAEAPRLDDEGNLAPGWLPDSLGREPGEWLESARGRTPEDWQLRRLEVGETAWGSLYQQHPTPPEGAVFAEVHIVRNRRPSDYVGASVLRVVAVDPSSGGSDEAGLVAGYRGKDSRAYVTHDRSGRMSSAEWTRAAWLLVVDTASDELVWEQNLVPQTFRNELVEAWRRIVRQVRTLDEVSAEGSLDPFTRRPTGRPIGREELLDRAALRWASIEQRLPAEQVGVDAGDRAQLAEVLSRMEAGLLDRVTESAPAKLHGVTATVGKRLRATPVATAVETNKVSHVGTLPLLELELTTWTEGQQSPGRLDAYVWLVTRLLGVRRGRSSTVANETLPTAPRS